MIDIIALVLSCLILLGAIISAAWRLGIKIGSLTEEVRGHNKRLDALTTELKTHIMNSEQKIVRRE